MAKRLLALVYSYYNNPRMFLRQVEEWEKYPNDIKKQLSIYITDDCTRKYKLRNVVKFPKLINGRAFEITRKVPWNWLACRNIGAHESKDKWLLLTDIDHLVSVKSMVRVFEFLTGTPAPIENWVYLFTRVDAPDNTFYKPHNDSFMMTRDLYWKIGGYDEELSGNYGTSGRYRRRAFEVAEDNLRLWVPLTRYPRDVISDASTREFPRKGKGRDPDAIRKIEVKKKAEGREDDVRVLSFPYKEIKWK